MFEGDVEELSLVSSKWVELEHCVSLAFQSVESKSPLPRAADCGDQVKQVYASFSKFSKNTEKKLKAECDLSEFYLAKQCDPSHILSAIAEHFSRESNLELSSSFANATFNSFRQLHEYKSDLAAGVVDRLLSSDKASTAMDLEFQLHMYRFLTIYREQTKLDAIQYARTRQIKRLMTLLVFPSSCFYSLYPEFVSEVLHGRILAEVDRAFCCVNKVGLASPLNQCMRVGSEALPKVFKVLSLLKGNRGLEWSQQDELPVEVQLKKNDRFHSVFCCPVLKQQTTANNPPMLLPCGHAICKEAILRLSKGSESTYYRAITLYRRFKCPYCPTETLSKNLVSLYF